MSYSDDSSLVEDLLEGYIKDVIDKIFDPIPVPIILVDKDTRILVMNQAFLSFLGVQRDDVEGKKVVEVDRNTRFPIVFKSKKAEIAWKHTFQNGHTAIVHRIPVLDDNTNVLFGFGIVLFQDMDDFKRIVDKNKLLESELSLYKNQLKEIRGARYSWSNIVGSSLKISQSKFMGNRASNTESTTLIIGESGTGKELFAHAIHDSSKRSHGPFVKINCAAIPAELLESELFGYEEGAFTGAKKGGKVGKFELANGGTIFLDEIEDMPMNMQVKLLRVLQEREVERIGSNKTVAIDVRIIAATNQDIHKLLKEGSFREDLYYRLNVMLIEIPPLRDRMEDLEEICDFLVEKVSTRLGVLVPKISKPAMKKLLSYSWPGNVRELENTLERAINISDGDEIQPHHLQINTQRDNLPGLFNYVEDMGFDPGKDLSTIIAHTERKAILDCLKFAKGNKQKTSKILGISRTTLYERMERYGIRDV